MATKTYTVKSGDTLGAIAKNAGVGISDITGYKSGNPDLIYPGENLTIGAGPTQAAAAPVNTTPAAGTTPDASGYAAAMKQALGGTTPSTTTGGATIKDDYLTQLRDSISGAQTTLSTAASSLANLKTTTYQQEYDASGLADKKNQIASIDQQIADKKAARDAATLQVKKNPGLSAALMTGTVSKLTDKANADINNLIEQRNSTANDYNQGLTEVGTKVANKVGDAQTAYDVAAKALEALTGQAKDYQGALVDTLKNNQTQDYQNNSLAISYMNALTNANRAANSASGTDLTLARDSDGNPLYWFDKQGNILPLSAADTGNIGGGNGFNDIGAAGTGNGSGTGAASTDTSGAQPWYQGVLNFFGLGGQ